jgi:hypothetical protein
MNDLKSNSFFNLSNSNRLNDSIVNNNNNNNGIDFNSNGVILDIKNNNEQIFINGIKLGSLLPKVITLFLFLLEIFKKNYYSL